MVFYNLYLTCYFKAYINVKIYSFVQGMKYIDKYIYHDFDCTTIQVDIEKNKVVQYF